MPPKSKLLGLRIVLLAQLCAVPAAFAQQTPPPDSSTPQPQATQPQATQPQTAPPADAATSPATPAPGETAAPSAPGAATGAAAQIEEPVAGGPSTPRAGSRKKSAEENIVVTGSRIRRKDLTSPAPVTIISKEQVAASGKVSIGDFLQSLPEQGNAINTAVNNGGDGSTRVSLRGLGANRTLVLLNGRRFVPGGTGANSSVDLNSIPAAAIERLEVLKDGASAVYGSDAIGGVVNIITRKNFKGTEANAFGGISPHGDGSVYDLNVTTGAGGDTGSILFSAGYYQAKPIFAGDRDFSKIPLAYDATGDNGPSGKPGVYSQGSGTETNGRIVLPRSQVGNTIPNPNNDPRITLYNNLVTKYPKANSFIVDPTAQYGFRPFQGSFLSPDGDGYNFQPENYLVTPQNRVQLYAAGERRFNSAARGFFEASYVNRQSDQKLAAEPLLTDLEGVPFSKDSIYNPFGRDLPAVRRRLLEFGNRTTKQDIDTFRIVGGVDGALPESFGPLGGWFYELSANYGRTQGDNVKNGNLNRANLAAALGPSFRDANGAARCGTKAAPIANCVPIDLLHVAGPITGDQIANLTFTGTARGINQLTTVQFNTGGELFKLFSDKPLGLAAGYEYRNVFGASIPDPFTVAGQTTGNKGTITRGNFYSNEGYAELSVPLLNNLPFVETLELSAAARAFNYSNFGSDFTYKVGGRYRPIRDITFRGTYSTAFRAPSISDLYAGNADNFPSVKDPCRGTGVKGPPPPPGCGAAADNGDNQSQLRSQVGGNPALVPETARITTLGVVLEPQMIKNLTVTVDYYHLLLDKAITTIGASTILSQCYPTNGAAPAFCDLIQRDPATGRIVTIVDTNTNVGKERTAGIDVAIRYVQPSEYGRFGFIFDGTYLNHYDRVLADGTIINGKGTYDLGVFPSFKFNAGVTWSLANFGAGVNTRFIGSYSECGDSGGDFSGAGNCYKDSSYMRRVGAYSVFDLFASYTLKSDAGKTNFAVGVLNVADKVPQTIYNGFLAASDPGTYDFTGRYPYFRATHTF